jgi:hypothetical protein
MMTRSSSDSTAPRSVRKRFWTLLVILLAALPAPAAAQFPGGGGLGGMRGMKGRHMGGPPNGEPVAMPTSAELSRNDPVLILLANKGPLSLVDSQVTQLLRIDATLIERNRPLLAEIDSLNAATPARDTTSGRTDQSAAPLDRRRAFANAVHEIHENERSAVDQSLALLDDAQRSKAEKLLQAQRDKSEKRASRG